MGEPANASDRRRVREQARRSDTSDPHHARARALKILFQADVRGVTPDVTLDRLDRDASARAILDDVEGLEQEQDLLGTSPQRPQRRPARGTAAAPEHDVAAPIDGFTRTLVLGVAEHRDELDALISRFARRWQISRMPAVDRTVLRLATYELLHEPTPAAVVIDEAVTLAASLSTDDSGRYVNGVLESVRKELASRPAGDATDLGPGPDTGSDPEPDAEPDPEPDRGPDRGPGPEPGVGNGSGASRPRDRGEPDA